MKKVIISILCLSLLTGSLFVPSKAAAAENNANLVITPMFTNINTFYNVFNIYDGGEACVDSDLIYRNADSGTIVVYLERYITDRWIAIKSWTGTSSDREGYCSGTYYVDSGSQYRIRAYGYVYAGGKLVDSTSYTSGPQYY